MFEYTFSFKNIQSLDVTMIKVFAKDYDAALRRAKSLYQPADAFVKLIEIEEV